MREAKKDKPVAETISGTRIGYPLLALRRGQIVL